MSSVAVVLYDDMWVFDFAVAVEVWGIDRREAGVPRFEFRTCSVGGNSVAGQSFTTIGATHDLSGLDTADLIIAPGRDHHRAPLPDAIGAALRAAHGRGTPIVGMCGGAFTLAQAGLLSGRRATTHWLLADDLRRMHPDVLVEQEDIYIEDNGIWTSAGTASLIDLCLHLVRIEHGAKAATTIARRMVTPPHRASNQRPYIETPVPIVVSDKPDSMQVAVSWTLQNLSVRQTTAQLAQRAHMSERSFIRRFAEVVGTSPQKWLLHQRLIQAQHLLETTELTVQSIAEHTGFGNASVLRRHFVAYFVINPQEYRRQFGAPE